MTHFAGSTRGFGRLVAAALLAGTAPAAFAQVTWVGGASNNWSTISNWTNGSLGNSFSQALVFGGANTTTSNDLTNGTVTSLTFSSGAGAFTLAGNSVTLTGTIGTRATNPQTISLPIVLSAGTHAINTVAGGSLVISGNISGGNTAGSRTLYLADTGTLTLSGNNSFTGNIDLNKGTLVVGHASALGSGTVVMASNSPFDVTSGQVFNITNGFFLDQGSGTFVGSGNGTLISSGTMLYNNANRTLTVSSGTFGVAAITNNASLFRLTKAGLGSFVISGSSTNVTGSFANGGGVVLIGHNNSFGSGTYTPTANSSVLRGYSSDLAGIPNPVMLAAGTTTIDGSYSLTFTGSLVQDASRNIINNVASGKAITFSGTTLLGTTAGRRLYIQGTGTTVFNGLITDSGLTGSGTIGVGGPYYNALTDVLSGTGGILVLSSSNNHTGGVSIETKGLLLINHPNALGTGSMAFNGTGSFDNVYGSPITVNNSIRMASSSGTFVGTNNSTFVTTGTLYWVGSRFLTVANSGTVEIGTLGSDSNAASRFSKDGNSGTLIINNAAVGASGTFALSGGTLIVGNNAALGSGTFEFASAAANFRAKSADLALANPVYLTTSTSTFTGAYGLSFGGGMLIENAALSTGTGGGLLGREIRNTVSAGKTLTFSGTTSLAVTGTNRTLTVAGTGDTVFSGPIIDGGSDKLSFEQGSSGTTTLSVANTYTGTTRVTAGKLVIGNAASLGNGAGRLDVGGGTLDLGGFNVSRSGTVVLKDSGRIHNGTITNNTATYDIQSGTVSSSAVLAGSVGLGKSTSGTATLENANTYGGTTDVAAGTLIVGNVSALSSGAVAVQAGAVLDLGGYAITNAITNNGGSIINAASYAGAQTLLASATFSSLSGASTLTVGNGGFGSFTGSIAASVAVLAGGTAELAAGGSFTQSSVANAGKVIYSSASDATLSTEFTGAGSFEKQAASTLTMAGTSSFGAGSTVSAGKLLVTGSIGGGAVNVANAATIGGSGQIGGDLAFASGAYFQFDPVNTLAVAGNTTFAASFGIANLSGLDGNTTAEGTYTLIAGNVDFTNVIDQGIANRQPIGGGKSAYLQQGSLQVVVVPEPEAITLVSFAGLALLGLGRRRKAKAA